MPKTISSNAIIAKNTQALAQIWCQFLEIAYPGESIVRITFNNEDLVWNTQTWFAAAFKLDDIKSSKDAENQTTKMTFVDLEGKISSLIDTYAGGTGALVTIYTVHSSNISASPVVVESMDIFEIIGTTISSDGTISLTLGDYNLSNVRLPLNRFFKNHCRYKQFKGTRCGYAGAETECDRSFTRCRELLNSERFGGFPAVGKKGIWK